MGGIPLWVGKADSCLPGRLEEGGAVTRIAFLIESLVPGGAQRTTVHLAHHWAAGNQEVFLLTLAAKEADFYILDPRVRRIVLGFAYKGGPLSVTLYKNLRRVLALRKALGRIQPDVTVAMGLVSNMLLGIAALGRHRSLLIGSERAYPSSLSLKKFQAGARRFLYGSLDGMVAQTSESAQWLRLHTRAKRVCVIPNGVRWPLPRQEPVLPVEKYVPEGRRLLLAVGRLEPIKGLDRLIQAFSRLANRHPAWTLVLLGEGPLRETLESHVRELGLTGRVHLPGAAGNIGDWYSRADLYALSSDWEGFPNTLLEALSAGVPAVCVDCEVGPRHILRHEIDGLLVPPGNSKALEAALDRMMSDPELRKRMAARAVEARVRFSVETIAQMWERFFRETAAAKGLSLP